MSDKSAPDLGEVQQTLYLTLLARAAETTSRRPLLRDQKAVEMVAAIDPDRKRFGGGGSSFTVLRTAIYDHWVTGFLAAHPDGTVVELGSGLNTRFERVDNGRVTWFDVDLPDTVALRGRFFTDTDRRHTIAASVLDEPWLDTVAATGGPYLFVSEGVLVYLPGDEVERVLGRIVARFPGARVAIDTYTAAMTRRQHQMAARRDLARWQWSCDDPTTLEHLGLRVRETASYRNPPAAMRRAGMPLRYRTLLPLLDRAAGGMVTLTLFDVPLTTTGSRESSSTGA